MINSENVNPLCRVWYNGMFVRPKWNGIGTIITARRSVYNVILHYTKSPT